MDKTLTRARRRNRRKQDRNWNAWQGYSPDGDRCRHCQHDASSHLSTSGQPHLLQESYARGGERPFREALPPPQAGRPLRAG